MVQANHTGQEEMRAGRMHGVNVPKSEPCFECKRMMPILLHIGKEE